VRAAIDYGCANCGAELDPGRAPERRPVPRRGGRNLPVCGECVKEIDAQTMLDVPGRPERVASAGGIVILDLGKCYPANRCVWCGVSDRREKVRTVVVKSAMARAVECENRKRCFRRQRERRTAA
jgi:hypothetical protein